MRGRKNVCLVYIKLAMRGVRQCTARGVLGGASWESHQEFGGDFSKNRRKECFMNFSL